MKTYQYYLFTIIITQIHCWSPVCVKQSPPFNPETAKIYVPEGSCTFREFVKKSDLFVDRTLFVQDVIYKHFGGKITFMHAPPKSGKSLNFDMIRTFLHPELDANGNVKPPKETWAYKFFKFGIIDDHSRLIEPPKLSGYHELIDEFLGQYPTIVLDYSPINVFDRIKAIGIYGTDKMRKTRLIFLSEFKEKVIMAEYRKHPYLNESLQRIINNLTADPIDRQNAITCLERLNLLESIKTDDELLDNETPIACSIATLCKGLAAIYQKKVFVFVDNYEKMFFSVYSNFYIINATLNDFKTVRVFLDDLMYATFLANEYVITPSILIGVREHRQRATLERKGRWFDIRHCKVLDYFTFTEDQVDGLLRAKQLDQFKSKVDLWYGGYFTYGEYVFVPPDRTVDYFRYQRNHTTYNTYSLARYINEKKFQPYFARLIPRSFFYQLLRFKRVRNEIHDLFCHDEQTKPDCLMYRQFDILITSRILFGEPYESLMYETKYMLSHLYSHGFLTIANVNRRKVYIQLDPEIFILVVKMPNYEIESEMADILVSWYQDKLKFPPSTELFQQTARAVVSFVRNPLSPVSRENFHDSIKYLFSQLGSYFNVGKGQHIRDLFPHRNYESMHCLLSLALIFIRLLYPSFVFLSEDSYQYIKLRNTTDFVAITSAFTPGFMLYETNASSAIVLEFDYIPHLKLPSNEIIVMNTSTDEWKQKTRRYYRRYLKHREVVFDKIIKVFITMNPLFEIGYSYRTDNVSGMMGKNRNCKYWCI